MKGYGTALRNIREAKGMTLEVASKGIISDSFLSQFEREKSDISLDNFFDLLDRLNITYSELRVSSLELNENTQQIFLKKYAKAYRSKNIVTLNNLIEQEGELYQGNPNIRHIHNTILCKQMIDHINKIKFNHKRTLEIVHYLQNVESWQYYEVCLFGNSIFFLKKGQLEDLSRIAFSRSEKYNSLGTNSSTFALVMMNVVNKLLQLNCFNAVSRLLKDIDKSLFETHFFYDKNRLNFLKGIYKIKTGSTVEGEDLCNEAIRLMVHFEASDVANILQTELDELLLENKKKIPKTTKAESKRPSKTIAELS
ncbi:Rgg/GadR/MutR family transcriptional regulator [Fundicoccus culcitae]|uniref:Helix-turn-helix domain-containing protein n=1 Tax=Fundicoccus culcitae TaxID=2969821 RepID=A0ABY5P7N1_9LACT|nr:Rgg/GadR/MutR family transcriptional regulator [Fundicoccus culcitae]UUX34458.1 helix-turn-helix domain-containing protein [Fundicoccus culcitae]